MRIHSAVLFLIWVAVGVGAGVATNATVWGVGVDGMPGKTPSPYLYVNTTYTFFIQAIDDAGNNVTVGGANFVVGLIRYTSISYSYEMQDNTDGTYTVTYTTPFKTGPAWQIYIYLDGNMLRFISGYLDLRYCDEHRPAPIRYEENGQPCLNASPTPTTTPTPTPTTTPPALLGATTSLPSVDSTTSSSEVTDSNDEAVPALFIYIPILVVVAASGMVAAAYVYFSKGRRDRKRWVALDSYMQRSGGSLSSIELESISPDLPRLFRLNENSFAVKVQPPVMNFETNGRLCPVGKPVTHDITLTNTSNQTQFFAFQNRETDKFTISFLPSSGAIKRGITVQVRVNLMFKCTARISEEVFLAVLDVGHVFLPLDAESELSTRIDVDEITLEEPPIGQGGFGVVHKAYWRGMDVAVKTMKTTYTSATARQSFEAECDMIAKLRHPNIINFVGAVISPSMVAMVIEYFPLGNLHKVIQANYLSYNLQVKLLLDTAKGMHFLHTSGILHRDLKADNVLVVSLNPDSQTCAKIADFGSSRTFDQVRTATVTGGIGTPTHMAPEILRGEGYTEKADVYSFAIVMYEVCTREDPYTSMDLTMAWDVANFVLTGQRLPLPSTIDPRAADLIIRCWSDSFDARPDFGEIIFILSEMLGVSITQPASSRKPLALLAPPAQASPDSSFNTPSFFMPAEEHVEGESSTDIDTPHNHSTDSSYSSSVSDDGGSGHTTIIIPGGGLPGHLHKIPLSKKYDSDGTSIHTSIHVSASDYLCTTSRMGGSSQEIRLPSIMPNVPSSDTATSTGTVY